ncbi:putative methyltransferase-domain-containing protein [Phlyctochytrium arcticum]|nr:putative methyltransferase-domain-containing protein [Phlyctochytrium arcticum]
MLATDSTNMPDQDRIEAQTVPYTYEYNDSTVPPLEIHQDPSGSLGAGVGATVWDAGLCLCKFLEKHCAKDPTLLANKRIIDIGSGTGIVGLVAARLARGTGCEVILTDKASVLPLLRKNVEMYSKSEPSDAGKADVQIALLDWTDPTHGTELALAIKPTMVLVADCFAFPDLYASLVDTLDKICSGPAKDDVEVLIAYEKRNFGKEMDFFALFGEKFTFRHFEEQDLDQNWRADDIFLFRAKKR